MIGCTFVLGFCMNFGLVNCLTLPKILPSIMDEFQIYQPTIIKDGMLEIKKMTKVVKNLNYQGYSIGFSQKQLSNLYHSGIILTKCLSQYKWNNQTRSPTLVVTKIETKEDLKEVEVSIGSEVIFLDWDSLKVYETYTINEVRITRYLGHFQANNEDKAAATFISSKDYISNMENRRGNFHGIELTGSMTHMKGDPGHYPNLVTFFPNNDTYDITKLANTPKHNVKFYDILELKIWKILESKFNFTSKLFMRKDMKIGSPHISSNGSTVIGEGVFQNLVEGSADFVCGAFTMLPVRLQFVDFLPASWSAYDAIFVQNEDTFEEIDWKVFFVPFAIEVWIAIVIKCLVFIILVSIIEYFNDYKLFYHSIIYNILASFMPNFGVAPFESKMSHLTSYKALLFSFAMDGLVLWISYQSFIYFDLSTAITKDPFNDLDSLANSDYILYSSPKDWSYYDILTTAQAFEKVMENNVDPESSFNSWDISVQKTLNTSKSAIFAHSDVLQWSKYSNLSKDLLCLLKPVWTSSYRIDKYVSIILKKYSQYTRFFTQEMRKMETTGNLDFLRKKYSGSQTCKPPLKEKPLGYEKLSFLFVMLIFGCIMSILVVFLEYMTLTKNKKQELSSKDKEIEEKIGEYFEVQGFSNKETENFLGKLFQKYRKRNKEDSKLNMNISDDDFTLELALKTCTSKIPRLITKRNSV